MTQRFGLDDSVIEKINGVFIKHPQIEQAVLYGSRAKGTFKRGSDIDLTLHGKDLNLDILYRVIAEFDDLLLPYTIDLSIFHLISDPDVVAHIQRVGTIFFQRVDPPEN